MLLRSQVGHIVDDVFTYTVHIQTECAYDIFYLPHVQQIFGYVFLAFAGSYEHDL